MAVVINEFEANVEAGGDRAAGDSRAPAGDRPHELRRKLRRTVVRALRIRP